jgi:hypothetical protein
MMMLKSNQFVLFANLFPSFVVLSPLLHPRMQRRMTIVLSIDTQAKQRQQHQPDDEEASVFVCSPLSLTSTDHRHHHQQQGIEMTNTVVAAAALDRP